MARLFGTDGVRGLANADLSPELALSLAVAAAHTLPDPAREQQPLVVVGRDPRASGEMLEAAVVAGLASAGANVVRVGVLPTPGVAYLTAEVRADFGVMISASHNPMPDNGIKFFAAGGHKLTDEQEDAIEAALGATWTRPTGALVGRVHDLLDGAEHYTTHLVEATGHPLAGIKVVVDCAHGAASDVAPDAFRGAGAEVVAINAEPDGLNINDECGATHLEPLKAAVVEHGAHLGIAVDGDADRCLAVDASGTEVDGDQIMAILALAMRDAGALVNDTLVATVMSNLGLRIAMREAGITLVEAKVGDRYVLEELRAGGFSLGGEQSGHVVFTEHATTGDGVLTGLRLLARVAQTGKSLAELASVVNRLPQVLINVRVADKAVARAPEILAAVAAAEAQLSGTGRVLLRPSGTEQLVRVMVEASGEDIAQKIAEDIAADVRAASPAV
ncbi:phosphoglucosamine mutase [Catellatospora methionotrophica]|uniref:Phosphoglucosamine mutase n=1 Tax=Catellatospora methionotrophica TaxID=121620 RepID=A0A8J3L2B6_9ACTN|nr:phosphoglucosamine mutase [Catellatospora methionotrophica]GIG13287.1 phosphoglucosamine mutase [Catellatospora methionotrophica]